MATQKIETGLIADSAVTTAKLADNSVTAAKIAAGSLDDQVKGISSSADAVAITIDSSENVGIGGSTITDSNLLNLQGSGASKNIGIVFNDTNTSKIFSIQNGGSALKFFDYTASAERMRIDSSGNVGIGVTPSAWDGAMTALQIDTGSIYANSNGATFIGANFYYDTTSNTNKYIESNPASAIGLSSGRVEFFVAGSGTAGNDVSFTEAMRIHSDGNVGIGTDDPQAKLHVTSSVLIEGGSTDSRTLGFTNANGSTGWSIGNGIIDSTHNFRIYDNTAGAARVTVDGSGNVGIGRTSISQPSAGATTLAIQGTDNNKAGAIRLYSADDSVSAWIYSDSGNGLSLNTATSHPMVFRTSATERLRIDADGIIRARSFRDVGHYLGPDGGVNVADDSTVTITDNVAGAMMVSIYDAGTGSGALYFVNYQGDPQVIKSSGILSFTDDDIDGFLCIYKTGAANSHTTVVKNRTGATRNLYISVFGSTT
jgi:hypothetical protein